MCDAPVLKRRTAANGLEFLGTPLADEQITEKTEETWINALQSNGQSEVALV